LGRGLANGGGGEVVKTIVLGGGAVPVGDIGFIPDLPEPGCGLAAVAIAEVGCVGEDKFGPLGFIFGRIGPAGEHFTLGKGVAVGLGWVESASGMKPISTMGRMCAGVSGVENSSVRLKS